MRIAPVFAHSLLLGLLLSSTTAVGANPRPSLLSVSRASPSSSVSTVPRGGSLLAGYHPLGYALTDLGSKFLEFDGSLDSDVGRFLASLKSGRKRRQALKDQWLEVVRVSKQGQSMRIYRTLDELIEFCLKAGFIS
eukprot:CAMPEP_0183311126 /NCGR_PEP_ID=MMETSP0160_2-20130417/35298_1 /TAXON_ID=2839 ORGANISM="Odontella Sinensis, Strain Grunow 1884" /NCGR_SAMPLE_ID=MMETSP0160_2 /ASSEMBLY_ACC=CAM_ASM_000250 /LENGTH=135 /DNA_ID=CAMNT_0025475615 /DNA_START=44 /DNA_END=451 /DNA_ORIENTATION=-